MSSCSPISSGSRCIDRTGTHVGPLDEQPKTVLRMLVEAWPHPLEYPNGRRLVAVCSYDCDLENPRSRTGILLAPVVKLPASVGSQREAEILASAKVVDGEIGYVWLFPLVLPIGDDGSDVAAVADFSAMATLGPAKDAVSALKQNRSWEMTDESRTDFQRKLALFTTRGDFANDPESGRS